MDLGTDYELGGLGMLNKERSDPYASLVLI